MEAGGKLEQINCLGGNFIFFFQDRSFKRIGVDRDCSGKGFYEMSFSIRKSKKNLYAR